MKNTKATKVETSKETLPSTKVPVNRQAVDDLAAYGMGEVETVSKRFIQAFPFAERNLVGYYLGTHQIRDRDGNIVTGKQDKPFIVQKFLTADTGELVYLPSHGMLVKQMEKDTELGAWVYRLQYLGKRETPKKEMAHVWDIVRRKATSPINLDTMVATDSADVEASDDLAF